MLYYVCRSGYGCGMKCLTADEIAPHKARGERLTAQNKSCEKR